MNRAIYERNQEIAAFVRQKDKDGSPYSQADIAYINQYVGYGGMWKLDEELSKERGLYEYYTPIEVVQKMVGLAHRYGYAGGPVLEPSCGIGRFLSYFDPKEQVTGIEIDRISYLIAKASYPGYTFLHQSFNQLFVDRRGNAQPFKPEYRLVIGNPPYGAFAGKGTQVEKQATRAKTYVDYFITRGLDLLLPGGLLIYIIPSAFLDGQESEVKTRIQQKATLLDAYRLPKRIFTQTDIQTDIVIFQKRKP